MDGRSRMSGCDETLYELVGYQLGTTSEAARDRVDLHLIECTSCLRAYLRLKHHVERGTPAEARPSDELRRRIRDDVSAIVTPHGAARVRALLHRPIPLYQSLFVAALVAGIAIGLPTIQSAFARRDAQPEARVDTSRRIAESLSIY
jgi:hypothetical protein